MNIFIHFETLSDSLLKEAVLPFLPFAFFLLSSQWCLPAPFLVTKYDNNINYRKRKRCCSVIIGEAISG